MEDCIFCSIVTRRSPAEILYEDEQVAVIRDILPKAPVHLLIISKEHIPSVTDVADAHQSLLGHMIFVAKQSAERQSVAETGYRLVFNVGKQGGQIIPHLHLHLLGGKQLAD